MVTNETTSTSEGQKNGEYLYLATGFISPGGELMASTPSGHPSDASPHFERPSDSQQRQTSVHSVSEAALTYRQPHDARFSRRWENARKEQEGLVDQRENALAARQRLRKQRKELGAYRTRAGDAEAGFITELRQFCEQSNMEYPPALAARYEEVQAARDALGAFEDDYNQAETSYDTLEWRFSERESNFYDIFFDILSEEPSDVLPDSTAPSEPSDAPNTDQNRLSHSPSDGLAAQYLSAVGEAEMIREQLNDLRREQAQHLGDQELRRPYNMDILTENQEFLDEFTTLYNDKLEQMLQAEIKVQRLRQEIIKAERPPEERRASDPWISTTASMSVRNVQETKRPQSESALANLRERFTDTRKRINQWILDSLYNSPLEKARHKSLIHRTDLDDNSWWHLVTQYWNHDDRQVQNSTANLDLPSPTAPHLTAKVIDSFDATSEVSGVAEPEPQQADVGFDEKEMLRYDFDLLGIHSGQQGVDQDMELLQTYSQSGNTSPANSKRLSYRLEELHAHSDPGQLYGHDEEPTRVAPLSTTQCKFDCAGDSYSIETARSNGWLSQDQPNIASPNFLAHQQSTAISRTSSLLALRAVPSSGLVPRGKPDVRHIRAKSDTKDYACHDLRYKKISAKLPAEFFLSWRGLQKALS